VWVSGEGLYVNAGGGLHSNKQITDTQGLDEGTGAAQQLQG
jgi:hypothetical protein